MLQYFVLRPPGHSSTFGLLPLFLLNRRNNEINVQVETSNGTKTCSEPPQDDVRATTQALMHSLHYCCYYWTSRRFISRANKESSSCLASKRLQDSFKSEETALDKRAEHDYSCWDIITRSVREVGRENNHFSLSATISS